jgi:selenocysteine lyase/cysteine desulfurase
MLIEAGFDVYDEGIVRSGIVTTATPAVPSQRLQEVLAVHHIAATYTEAGSSRWDVERRRLPNLLRLSVHYTTTPAELEVTVEVLIAAVSEGR